MKNISEEYKDGIKNEINLIISQINSKIRRGGGYVVIFGAGNYGTNVLEKLIEFGYRQIIAGICDNDDKKFGHDVCGFKVSSYNDIKIEYTKCDLIFLICSNWYNDIKTQLLELNEKIYVVPTLSYLQADAMLRNHSNQYKKENTFSFRQGLSNVNNILEDEESKSVLNSIINLLSTRDWRYLDLIDVSKKQYFSDDIYNFSDSEIYVDLGAANGDTILKFINTVNNKYKKIIAFEPQKELYNELIRNINNNQVLNIDTYNLGCWKEKAKLNFSYENLGASHIDDCGEFEIDVNSLDNMFSDVPISFIKMDIEGAEKEVIIGAQSIIKKYKPKLAVCVYHKIKDIYEIPLMLKKIVPEYRIYLRHHNRYVTETVCYATI